MRAQISKILFVFPVALFGASACAPTQVRPIEVDAGLSGEEYALVAFSADSTAPLALRGLKLMTFNENNQPKEAGEVPVISVPGGSQLFLYEFKVNTARFGSAMFEYEADYWESTDLGPEFSLQPGTLTYLGRIQLPLVQMGRYADSGRSFPAGARLVMTDASAVDLERLAVHFPSTADMTVNKIIPVHWTESESMRLRYVKRPPARVKTEGPDPLHDPPIPTEIIFEPTEIPP